jgi:hypothetical protein
LCEGDAASWLARPRPYIPKARTYASGACLLSIQASSPGSGAGVITGAGTAAQLALTIRPPITINFHPLNECMFERASVVGERYKKIKILRYVRRDCKLCYEHFIPDVSKANQKQRPWRSPTLKRITTHALHCAPDSLHARRPRKSTQRGEK